MRVKTVKMRRKEGRTYGIPGIFTAIKITQDFIDILPVNIGDSRITRRRTGIRIFNNNPFNEAIRYAYIGLGDYIIQYNDGYLEGIPKKNMEENYEEVEQYKTTYSATLEPDIRMGYPHPVGWIVHEDRPKSIDIETDYIETIDGKYWFKIYNNVKKYRDKIDEITELITKDLESMVC